MTNRTNYIERNLGFGTMNNRYTLNTNRTLPSHPLLTTPEILARIILEYYQENSKMLKKDPKVTGLNTEYIEQELIKNGILPGINRII